MISAEVMAAPLSLNAARGRPRFWNACDRPWATFSAFYHENEEIVTEQRPPLSRCLVLPVPADQSRAGAAEQAARLGDFLARDLTTPLGRLADLLRLLPVVYNCPRLDNRGDLTCRVLLARRFGSHQDSGRH